MAAATGPFDVATTASAAPTQPAARVRPQDPATIAQPALRREVTTQLARDLASTDRLHDASAIAVELVAAPGQLGELTGAVIAAGGSVRDTAPSGVVLADVPAAHVAALETAPGIIRRPVRLDVRPARHQVPQQFGPTTGSVEAITKAGAWHAAGFDGTGVRVGIIDFFDVVLFWDVDEMGPDPTTNGHAMCLSQGANCNATYNDAVDDGGDDHGPAVTEVVKDMAPGAQIYIGSAGTITDYYALIDWFAANGVRIVNRSLGSIYDGPGDGRGALDAVADYAVAKGITWINAGGNEGHLSYYRRPVDVVGGYVAFQPTGSTWLPIQGCSALGGLRWANDWDLPPASRTDYRLELYEADGGLGSPVLRDFADDPQRQGFDPIENFANEFCPSPGRQLFVRVRLMAGSPAGDTIEILEYFGAIPPPYSQAASSASSPVVDSANRGVLAVGAIDPPDGATIAGYSSRGPTNDGRIKPDLAAPAGFNSTTFNGIFSGTSAAAPTTTGAAAVLLDAGLATGATELADLVRHATVERGPTGRDNDTGVGELRLPPPPTAGLPSAPSRFVPLTSPQRRLDTRAGLARHPDDDRRPWAGEIIDIPMRGTAGVPKGAAVLAVAVNVTVVDAPTTGYVQVLPTAAAALGAHSNLNLDTPGQVRPNFAIVPLGQNGAISVYVFGGGHVLVDVLGYFTTAGGATSAGRLEPVAPRRLVDSRTGAATPVADRVTIPVGNIPGVDTADVAALVLTVTATNASTTGYVEVAPIAAGTPGATSSLNLTTAVAVANTVIVPVGTQGVGVTPYFPAGGSVHLIVDVTGYITSSSAPSATTGRFVPLRPGRVYDSRPTAIFTDGETRVVGVVNAAGPLPQVPAGATAVAANLTVTESTRYGFLQVWASDQAVPGTSSLNWSAAGTTTATGAVVPLTTSGRLRLLSTDWSNATTGPLAHHLVDIFGYFTS